MFQFPRLPLPGLCVQPGVAGNGSRRVYPFGDPRVKGYVPLAAAYRSLSRPSSASSAKASTVCPYHLLLDGSVHTYTARDHVARAIRCDLLEKENIVFVTLCSSQGTRGGTLKTGYCALAGVEGISGSQTGTAPKSK